MLTKSIFPKEHNMRESLTFNHCQLSTAARVAVSSIAQLLHPMNLCSFLGTSLNDYVQAKIVPVERLLVLCRSPKPKRQRTERSGCRRFNEMSILTGLGASPSSPLKILLLLFALALCWESGVTAFVPRVSQSVGFRNRRRPVVQTQQHHDNVRLPTGASAQSLRLRVSSSALSAFKSLDAAASDSTSSGLDSSSLPPPPPDDDAITPKKSSTDAETQPRQSGMKLRRLKDIMWVRETLEDLTAAEFACNVEAHHDDYSDEHADNNNTNRAPFKRSRRKRAVDYEKILSKLNSRIQDLGCDNMDTEQLHAAEFQCVLDPKKGMGSLTYTDEQRTALLQRLIATRMQLIGVIRGSAIALEGGEDSGGDLFSKFPELPRMELPKEMDEAPSGGPKLYVRDDGTVDWDGALQDQAALRKFGTAVWQRINGRDWEGGDEGVADTSLETKSAGTTQVTAKVADTPEIKRARDQLDTLKKDLIQLEKEHYRLLNSAISQGSATANVKLAAVEPKLRSKIQASAVALNDIKVKVSFQTLVYELERIYTYLLGELGNPAVTGYVPLQDRLNVAEFGLLESQIDSFNRQFEDDENVDEDVLVVVFEQLTDFKRRLGIDYYVAGLSFDREAIGQWLGELWMKTKKGLAFYVKGVRLFWNDIVFCLRLINRAAQGYTLKPREVRTIRRTFKDIITFIPFVIILLIPLSPIGHVLVFGAIQRFFPDFFPSCFTEQRQNLLQLYETAEYSEMTINETWQEKASRFTEAILYLTANALRTLFFKVRAAIQGESKSNDESSGSMEGEASKKGR